MFLLFNTKHRKVFSQNDQRIVAFFELAVLYLFCNFCVKKSIKQAIKLLIVLSSTISLARAGTLSISFNAQKTTPLLNPPYISSVINTLNDPAKNLGFVVDILEDDKPILKENYQLQTSSSNSSVIDFPNISIEKQNGFALIKLNAQAVGYSNITITATKGKSTETLTVYLAASNSNLMYPNFWHTGYSDASAAIRLNDSLMLVADDENNVLSVYHQKQSGLPVSVFDYDEYVSSANDDGKEIDCEAAVKSKLNNNIIYFIGSHGNGGKAFSERPKRNTLMAVSIDATSSNIKFKFKDAYTDLRRQLIKWGDANNYKFSKCAASGEKPKQLAGFNIEGMCFAPDEKTLWIAFRAPLVPTINRNNAVLTPIKNFEQWFNSGHKNKQLEFDKPIELNLMGRGVRDIIQLSNQKYLIVAGGADETKNTALFLWNGDTTITPKHLEITGIHDLNIEAVIEIKSDTYSTQLQLLCDDGSTNFYNDGIAAKNLHSNFKKFRSILVTVP